MAKYPYPSKGSTNWDGLIEDNIDAAYDRANHTGHQSSITISDFAAAADARVQNAVDTDATMAANSDTKVPSQKAVRTALATASPAAATHAAASKPTPVDADEIPLADSAASWVLKKLTWANLKNTLSGFFATLASDQTITGTKTFRPATYQPTFSGDIAPAMSSWSGSGAASLSGETWTLGPGAWTLTCSVEVVGGNLYQIDTTTTPYSSAEMTVSLGSVVANSRNDPGRIALVADTTGTVTLSISGSNTGTNDAKWTVRAVTVSTPVMHVGGSSIVAFSNNNAMGTYAQRQITTGYSNNAMGADAQRQITTGTNNNAMGTFAAYQPRSVSGNATTTANYQVTIGGFSGQSSSVQVDGIVVVGYRAVAGAQDAVAIGRESKADHNKGVALGDNTSTTRDNQVMIGPRDLEISSKDYGLVLTSPDGSKWRGKIDNSGVLSWAKI